MTSQGAYSRRELPPCAPGVTSQGRAFSNRPDSYMFAPSPTRHTVPCSNVLRGSRDPVEFSNKFKESNFMVKTIANLIEARFGMPAHAGREMPAEGVLAATLTRRVHRSYTPAPVTEDVLQMVLAAALSAPRSR